MAFRDGLGNSLNDGDSVAISLGAGQIAHGVIARTSSLVSDPSQPSMLVVSINMVLAAQPNGVVGGVFKIAMPPKATLEG
jgi:hypothetical protein